MVEPMIHDYYNDNEMPTMVHVIDKMNEELEDLRKEKEEEIAELKIEISELKQENIKLQMEKYCEMLSLPKTSMTNTYYQIPTPVDIINNIITNTTLNDINLNN